MLRAPHFGLFVAAFIISGATLHSAAQTFTTLHSFSPYSTPPTPPTNTDGVSPVARLLISGNDLYGVTTAGTPSGAGTLFALKTDGTGFTNLHNFGSFGPGSGTNSDGASPESGLILIGQTLYGTTYNGGVSGSGTVFSYDLDGMTLTNLHFFSPTSGNTYSNIDGANPRAVLCPAGSNLFGTTESGGTAGAGTVFAIQSDGTGFTNLHNFPAQDPVQLTNVDGSNPLGGVVLSGATLYGVTLFGGYYNNGTLYKINTDGSGFTNLHQFAAGDTSSFPPVNADGISPQHELVISGNSLYGVTVMGGSLRWGTIFTVNTDGTGFTVLHNFNQNDGASPAALVLQGTTLYGATQSGGTWGNGAVFAINIDGTGFTNLYQFSATVNRTNSDGALPQDGLIVSGTSLYGTTAMGGNSGSGTVFKISFEPQLGIQLVGTNVVLSWPTNVVGFSYADYKLQSTGTLDSPAWTDVSADPATENSQFSVSIPTSETQQFFRLTHL